MKTYRAASIYRINNARKRGCNSTGSTRLQGILFPCSPKVPGAVKRTRINETWYKIYSTCQSFLLYKMTYMFPAGIYTRLMNCPCTPLKLAIDILFRGRCTEGLGKMLAGHTVTRSHNSSIKVWCTLSGELQVLYMHAIASAQRRQRREGDRSCIFIMLRRFKFPRPCRLTGPHCKYEAWETTKHP